MNTNSPRVPGRARRWWAALFAATVVAFPVLAEAGASPARLRIATFAYVQDGKVHLGGNGSYARVIADPWLADRLRERGVTLEWVPVSGDTGPVINEAFAAGRIDFATYGDLPSLILNGAGVRTRVVVPSGRGSDVFVVVPAKSPVRSLRELKGKRVSVHRSRPWELTLYRLLEAEGLAPRDIRLINMEPRAGAAALAGGKVDAFVTNNPFLLEERGLGRILWSSRGRPDYKMRAELWGRSDFIDRHPELTQIVATAFVRAAHWSAQEANREGVIREGTRNGTPERVVRRGYDDATVAWADRFSPLFDDLLRAQYGAAIDLAQRRRLIARPLRVDELVAPRFVEAALRELGLAGHWRPATAPRH